MSEIKFTKGPWKIEFTGPHWNNKDLRNIEIQYGEHGECICDTVYDESDANLISCAPDMYEMLERVMSNYQVLASVAAQDGIEFNEYKEDSKEVEVLLKRARG